MGTPGAGEEAEGLQLSADGEASELPHATKRLEGAFFAMVVLRRVRARFAPCELG